MATVPTEVEELHPALQCAVDLTEEIEVGTKTLRRERALCWKAAHEAGLTWAAIAEACGVSANLPPYDVARLEHKPWVWTDPL